ncbi:MAG: ROK family protein [Candidatus Marinimicrobia bacterium]|nr:ROK family protein [Candidatus Neomarinimicrobiota bacterium]
MKKVVLGIDIGGTNTVFAWVDKSGNILSPQEISTQGTEPAQKLVDRLGEKVDQFLKNNSDCLLIGIGVGAPNANHFSGIIQNPPNLDWGEVDIVSILSQKYFCDVKLTNDANAAALGEKYYGLAKEMDDFIMITLGTGLGSGIYSNGRILYGDNSMAGELGHLSIDPNGRLCTCGLKGCLEMYVSAKGIKETIKEMLDKNPDDGFLNSLNMDNLDGKKIDAAVDRGNVSALNIYKEVSNKLGFGLAQAAILFSPNAFIFYGGYSQAGDRLLFPTRVALESYLMDNLKGKIQLLQSGLPVGHAGILGAASLIWHSKPLLMKAIGE